jgi:hypothetical protein
MLIQTGSLQAARYPLDNLEISADKQVATPAKVGDFA